MVGIITAGICSILLILSPLFTRLEKYRYVMRFFSCIFIVSSGVKIFGEFLGLTWFASICMSAGYLLAVMGGAKLVESKLK